MLDWEPAPLFQNPFWRVDSNHRPRGSEPWSETPAILLGSSGGRAAFDPSISNPQIGPCGRRPRRPPGRHTGGPGRSGMDSNHELDRILKSHKLLILQSRRSRQKHQKQASGTKSVQKFFLRQALSGGRIEHRRSSLSRRVQLWQRLNLVPALASIHGLNRDVVEIQIENGGPFLSQGW